PVGPPEGPRLPAGWALYLMFGGLFVWWFLGLSGFVQAIFAVPLLVTLVARRGGVAMPRAFWLWLLFLAFMFASASQLSDANNALSWGRSEERRVGKECRARVWPWDRKRTQPASVTGG